MNRRTFRSKVDWWLRIAILVPVIGSVAAVLAISVVKSPFLAVAVLPLVLISVGVPMWILRSTYYTFGDRELNVRCGPFEWRIPLNGVRAVTPTHNPLSSPALSLDRLRIDYGVRDSIMVSPDDKTEFLRELKRRVPVV